jgi:hypothetical protein
MKPLRFWGTAGLAAVGLGVAVALLFPFGPLGIETLAERQRAWLLTVWTSGVMAICFGATGLLATVSPITFRDVAEAGSVVAAIEARRSARQGQSSNAYYNFAGWSVSTGLCLLLLYFVGWLILGR